MFKLFTITVHASDYTQAFLKKIEKACENKEILGQLIDPIVEPTLKIDPDRVSHSVKNIRYNNVTQTLVADIECLPTVYGTHLYKCFENNLDKLSFHPLYYNNKLITVNISIKDDKNAD